MFRSQPDHYTRNTYDGDSLNAKGGFLTGPDGKEPGVVIRHGYSLRFIIPAQAALRLANEIADAVEEAERAAAA